MQSMDTTPAETKRPDPLAKILRVVLSVMLGVIIGVGAWVWYVYAVTPAAIRHPSSAHFHFRLQVITGGAPSNFAENIFQTPFNKDICTAALTAQPVHFHDNEDQFVHIHWAGISGGLLLKDYGWNLIGGPGDSLGWRFDKLPSLSRVAIHSQALPSIPSGSKFYVYVGNQDSYQDRRWDDFLHQNLDTFLPATTIPSERDAAKLNNVRASVVIFAQKNKPTAAQVHDRFQKLVPLPTSSCSG
jgi:hypothetical protein